MNSLWSPLNETFKLKLAMKARQQNWKSYSS